MVAYFLYATPITAEIASKKQKLALHFAAGDGHTAVVRNLLHVYPKGASLPSAKGKLPLHFAARWGHIQIASDLLFLYPEGVRCVDWDGSLPLHDAAREGQVLMSKFLIERYPIVSSSALICRSACESIGYLQEYRLSYFVSSGSQHCQHSW
jgi:ankyrin repeat protein